MPEYAVALESWSPELWRDTAQLATDHFVEVDGGVEPRRRFRVDQKLMTMLEQSGALKIVTARRAGCLVGYYTWNVTPDVESAGLLIAQQGAWYVAPNNPKAAILMFDFAVEVLRGLGVQCIYPHHRTQGRGSHLGRFFKRRGAKEIQHTYSLWIGA